MGNYPVKNVGRKTPEFGGIVLLEQVYDKEHNVSLKDILKAVSGRLGDLQIVKIESDIQHGSVSADVSVAYSGQTVVLTAVPATGYEFSAWSVTDADGGSVTVTGNTFVMPSKDVTVSATFEAIDYTIGYDEEVEGGTITGPSTGNYGNEITLTATPDTGKQLAEWTVTAGETPITVTSNKFTMPASDVEVSATFAAIDYDITYDENVEGGSISGPDTGNYGDEITLTATPDTGKQLSAWAVTSGGAAITVTSNKFTMPAGGVEVSATFDDEPES